MKKSFIFTCMLSLLLIPYAYAEDKLFSGGIFLGGRALNLDRQSAKFNEYGALTPGLFGGGDVAYDSDTYHFTAEGAYLAEDDMYLKVKGGKWGVFKYSLFYNEFPHNLSFKDRTIFVNPGSDHLTLAGPAATIPRNSALWPSTSFDYKIRRKDTGGSFDLSAIKPFFFNVEANQLRREGQVPWGAPTATLGFGNTVEFPVAVDNTTTNINLLGGWKNKQFYAALGGGYSRFNNHAEYTRYTDPFATLGSGATATIVGAPDNKSWNLKFTGTAKLPYASTFALTAGFTNNTSTTRILNTIEDGVAPVLPFVRTIGLSRTTFNGDVQYWNIGATLTSNPWKDLTTKIYLKYFDKKNRSDFVTFSVPGSLPVSTEQFDYQKTNVGVEASYRFLKNLKGILGYDFTDVRRRVREQEGSVQLPIPDTWDHKLLAQLNYNPLDWLGGRLKYERLYRGSNTNFAFPADPTNTDLLTGSPNQNNVLQNNLRRFDATNKVQDMVKFTADIAPLQNLDFAIEYAYKFDNYYKDILGLQEAKRNEFILDGAYDLKGIKFFAFFDYDKSSTKQQSRNVSPAAGSNANPGSGVVNANSYNWAVTLDNSNYAYGIGTSFPIVRNKLTVILQYDFEKNNGTADFTSQFLSSARLNQSNIDITPFDDYTRQSVSARLRYDAGNNLTFVLGYLYSQFRYNDAQVNGYQYTMPTAGAVNTYLTGAYTDQSYKTNTVYIRTMYRF